MGIQKAISFISMTFKSFGFRVDSQKLDNSYAFSAQRGNGPVYYVIYAQGPKEVPSLVKRFVSRASNEGRKAILFYEDTDDRFESNNLDGVVIKPISDIVALGQEIMKRIGSEGEDLGGFKYLAELNRNKVS